MYDSNDGFVWDSPKKHPPKRGRASQAFAPSSTDAPRATTPKAEAANRPTSATVPPAALNEPAWWRIIRDLLFQRYLRVKTTGWEHLPTEGPAIIACNHAGGPLPLDGAMVRHAIGQAVGRSVCWVNESFFDDLPLVGRASRKLGAVRAGAPSVRQALEKGELVVIFPEGADGISKPFHERQRLTPFAPRPYLTVASEQELPIIPCCIRGAQDIGTLVYRLQRLASSFGLTRVPLSNAPWRLGALGLLPAPTSWHIHFGPPISTRALERQDDKMLASTVQQTMQSMIDDLTVRKG